MGTPAMPTYTLQQDPPWIPARTSEAPSATSMYSEDVNTAAPESLASLKPRPSYHPSYHAHPQQQIKDRGPQIRHSRLPIFKQVRSMLHRPPPIMTPANPKWDNYTGELSESGKPSTVKPSTYTSPYDGAFQTSRKPSPARPKKNSKDQSPVSILRDEEVTPVERVEAETQDLEDRSPVSPVSPDLQSTHHPQEIIDQSLLPEPLSPNVQRASQQTSPSLHVIKRKPVSRCISAAENQPPTSPHHSPSQSSDMSAQAADDKDDEFRKQPVSHFSWTTYAPTVAPERHSIDTMATRQTNDKIEEPKSRFSWSTVATQPARRESPPPSPPQLPAKYSTPPMQSILSRRRPVQRTEKLEWEPPSSRDRSGDETPFATPIGSSTPTPTSAIQRVPLSKLSTPTSASPSTTSKALPPPPQLNSAHNLTHLEALLAQERDIVLQRTNVERGISDMEKIEKASPMDVPFATVRDAKKRLAEYRTRLDEVKLEERDIGVAIARARRKEEKVYGGGDVDTLWVRKHSGNWAWLVDRSQFGS